MVEHVQCEPQPHRDRQTRKTVPIGHHGQAPGAVGGEVLTWNTREASSSTTSSPCPSFHKWNATVMYSPSV